MTQPNDSWRYFMFPNIAGAVAYLTESEPGVLR
jgi:hypothetical protein